MSEERFKSWKIENRKLILSDVNEFGVLFQVEPLVGLHMDSDQMKAELKVANIKLDKEMEKWINDAAEFFDRRKNEK